MPVATSRDRVVGQVPVQYDELRSGVNCEKLSVSGVLTELFPEDLLMR